MTIQSDKNSLRVVKTARELQKINEAVGAGFFPLIKPINPSERIRRKVAVLQNRETGETEEIVDYRAWKSGKEWEIILDFTWFYPHSWNRPYAAYLIPKDIQTGERVWIEDLIEDLVGGGWNQGDKWRLAGCEAVWDGSDLLIDYDESNVVEILG